MTEPADLLATDQKSVLQRLGRSSGHELRNALSGMVVNLEVVRSRTAAAGVSVEPFMAQTVAQSEESIRLAEAAIALLLLMASAAQIDRASNPGGNKNEVRIEAGSEAERFEKALGPLVLRRVVAVERLGSAVILRIPEESTDKTGTE